MQVQSPSALDLRCKMALARAICTHDNSGAARIAHDTFKIVVQTIHEGANPAFSVTWPITTDPVLSIAYQTGIRLLERRNELCKQLEVAKANADLREGAHQVALQYLLMAEPSANFLFQELLMRKVVEMNQHTLKYVRKFRGLFGTNPYGIEYYAGKITMENVEQWRTAMIKGETWGASPVPEWDGSCATMEDSEVRYLHLSIEWIDHQFADLANMRAMSFAPGYTGLVYPHCRYDMPHLPPGETLTNLQPV